MTRNITLKIQPKFCGTSWSQALMHLSYFTDDDALISWLESFNLLYVAVLGRNRTLFCCVFSPHYSNVLGKLMNIYHVYTAHMRPTLSGISALERFRCSNAIEICNVRFYLGLPHMLYNSWDSHTQKYYQLILNVTNFCDYSASLRMLEMEATVLLIRIETAILIWLWEVVLKVKENKATVQMTLVLQYLTSHRVTFFHAHLQTWKVSVV